MTHFYNALMFVGLFMLIKAAQMVASFMYTTYKSLVIHRSWAHAFNPGLSERLRHGLRGDAAYYGAGVFIALYAAKIRALIF
ncbi:MAG: hypothetical protein WAN43_02435 [Rhodomicrobium sp.]|jgi:hypothetical protein